MLQQLLFQDAARLNVEASIDGLMRHVQRLGLWKRALEPSGDLLLRPVQFQFLCNSLAQPSLDGFGRSARFQAWLAAGPIMSGTAITADLSTLSALP